jgi:hypothetical protein
MYKVNPYTDLRKYLELDISTMDKSDTVEYLTFGKKVYDQIVKIKDYKKTSGITIDLAPGLEQSLGHIVLLATPTVAAYERLL